MATVFRLIDGRVVAGHDGINALQLPDGTVGLVWSSELLAEMQTYFLVLLGLTRDLPDRRFYLNEGLAAVYFRGADGREHFVEVVTYVRRRKVLRSSLWRRDGDQELTSPDDLLVSQMFVAG